MAESRSESPTKLMDKLLSQWSQRGALSQGKEQLITLTKGQEELLLNWYNSALQTHGLQVEATFPDSLLPLAAWCVFGTAELESLPHEICVRQLQYAADEFLVNPVILPSLICSTLCFENDVYV